MQHTTPISRPNQASSEPESILKYLRQKQLPPAQVLFDDYDLANFINLHQRFVGLPKNFKLAYPIKINSQLINNRNPFAAALNQALQDSLTDPNTKLQFFLPFSVDAQGHWELYRAEIKNGQILSHGLFDSMKYPSNSPTLAHNLAAVTAICNSVLGSVPKLNLANPAWQENDSVNCGPFVLQEILAAAAQGSAPQRTSDPLELRAEILAIYSSNLELAAVMDQQQTPMVIQQIAAAKQPEQENRLFSMLAQHEHHELQVKFDDYFAKNIDTLQKENPQINEQALLSQAREKTLRMFANFAQRQPDPAAEIIALPNKFKSR